MTLVTGKLNLISKGLTVIPTIMNSDIHQEISVAVCSTDVWVIEPGDLIAQILFLLTINAYPALHPSHKSNKYASEHENFFLSEYFFS